ncbi:hypothetical protein LSCM1_00427 [Leishmania martiniquensis]|uniref:Transmembrane protein n=1 Tax=Leishmania martiniquensis TaxID=1580590 RepID=A0A836GSM4_9TRYP|nr:hypothetical protein LSCM1_00427 [Leishmania martiniquensis]
MAKTCGDVEKELANLRVPAHSLCEVPLESASLTPSNTVMTPGYRGGTAQATKSGKLRERIKPYPVARRKPAYYGVLEDAERRRAREMRRTLRLAEAEKRKQRYRMLAAALVLIMALGLGLLKLSHVV